MIERTPTYTSAGTSSTTDSATATPTSAEVPSGNLDGGPIVSSVGTEDYASFKQRESDNLAITPERAAMMVALLLTKLSKITSDSAEAQIEATSAINKKELQDAAKKIQDAIEKIEKALKKRKFALGLGLGASSLGVLISAAVLAASISATIATGGAAAPLVGLAIASMSTLGATAALAGQASQAAGHQQGWSLSEEFGKMMGNDAGGQLLAGLMTLNFGEVTAAGMEMDKAQGYSDQDKMIASVIVGVIGGLVVAAVGGAAAAKSFKLIEVQRATQAGQPAQAGVQAAQAADNAQGAQAVADNAVDEVVEQSVERAMQAVQQLLRRASSSADYFDAIVGGALQAIGSGFQIEAAKFDKEAGTREADAQEKQAGVEYRFGRMQEAIDLIRNNQQTLMAINSTVSEIVSQFFRSLAEMNRPQHAAV